MEALASFMGRCVLSVAIAYGLAQVDIDIVIKIDDEHVVIPDSVLVNK